MRPTSFSLPRTSGPEDSRSRARAWARLGVGALLARLSAGAAPSRAGQTTTTDVFVAPHRGLAQAPATGGIGAVSAADVARLDACWQPRTEPDLATFLDGAPDADVAWRPTAIPLWGDEGALLTTDGLTKVANAHPLTDDPERLAWSATAASILVQQPQALANFISQGDDLVSFNLSIAMGGAGESFVHRTLEVSSQLPLHQNETRAAGASQMGSFIDYGEKLVVKLAACNTSIGLTTPQQVIEGVLGRAPTTHQGMGGEIAAALAPQRNATSRTLGTLTFAPDMDVAQANVSLSQTPDLLTLQDANGTTNVTLRLGVPYGVMGVFSDVEVQEALPQPTSIELFDPLGRTQDGALPYGRTYASPASETLVLPFEVVGEVQSILVTTSVAP